LVNIVAILTEETIRAPTFDGPDQNSLIQTMWHRAALAPATNPCTTC